MRIGPLMLALCLVTTPAAADESGRTLDAFRTFVEVYERIRQQYVEVHSDEDLMQYAIEGMLGKLDERMWR